MKSDIKNLIKWVHEEMGLQSPEADTLVFRTMNHESLFKHLSQVNGPAIGFSQLEMPTVEDTWNRLLKGKYTKAGLICHKLTKWGYDGNPIVVQGSIILQIAFCRLKYYLSPGNIPKTLEGQAAYWKQWYNTPEGKGTIEEFCGHNK